MPYWTKIPTLSRDTQSNNGSAREPFDPLNLCPTRTPTPGTPQEADIIFMPYNYLLDPHTRKSLVDQARGAARGGRCQHSCVGWGTVCVCGLVGPVCVLCGVGYQVAGGPGQHRSDERVEGCRMKMMCSVCAGLESSLKFWGWGGVCV